LYTVLSRSSFLSTLSHTHEYVQYFSIRNQMLTFHTILESLDTYVVTYNSGTQIFISQLNSSNDINTSNLELHQKVEKHVRIKCIVENGYSSRICFESNKILQYLLPPLKLAYIRQSSALHILPMLAVALIFTFAEFDQNSSSIR
jgi:hypothetical protein